MPNPLPLFPTPSTWTKPKDFPNLAAAKIIGLDTETRDPQLLTKGPGVRRDGYLCGISVAVEEGDSWYFPFAHNTGDQFEKKHVIQWVKDNLCNPNQPKVGANLLYDLDYLMEEGVDVTGPFYDVQNAEPLINENRLTYSLDSLAKRYLGETKEETLMISACNDHRYKGKPQSNIWRLDPKYVGPYAEIDAELPIRIFKKQQVIMREQELERVFDLETRLVPMLLHMRRNGVPIDVARVMDMRSSLMSNLQSLQNKLNNIAGRKIDIWAADQLAKVFDKMGLDYPLTQKTEKPSFTQPFLDKHDSEIAQLIVDCRKHDKLISTFVEGALLNMMVDGRIHCQFNQLKGDGSGTVTGRLSSSKPNLQQIPNPKKTELGKMIRQCFTPDDGFEWVCQDYSQIEIRMLVHYGMGEGVQDIIDRYNENPKTDYHKWCSFKAGLAKESDSHEAQEKARDNAKTINFGIIYEMGKDKLAADLGISVEEAGRFISDYYLALPFLKQTTKAATEVAERRGYVKTLMGRRRRFELWEPRDRRLFGVISPGKSKKKVEAAINAFMQEHGFSYRKGANRAYCYRAFNAADQGSSADIMKIALVNIWESGLCDTVKMYLTVHDEIDYGCPMTKEGQEAKEEIANIMRNAYKLKVPLLIDTEVGPSWGDIK